MLSKREHIKSKITDVIISSDTTEAQGFLFEGGDDCAEVVHRDEDDLALLLEKQWEWMNNFNYVEVQEWKIFI
jgi:hypothetical protein